MSGMALAAADITGLVLAGGRGSRMGGVDKGLQWFNGVPLAQHALQRLRPQVGTVALNANRNLASYEGFGAAVWPDTLPDYAGPLAGFLTGLAHCRTDWLLTVPCDTPLFPADLASRLAQAAAAHEADIALVSAPEVQPDGRRTLRPQPVFALLRRTLQESLLAFTQGGGRKVGEWTARHRCVLVPFDQAGDDPAAFSNANTLAELHALQQQRG